MNRSDKPSILGTIFECLEMIWEPAGQAFKVQKELGIRSLKETPAVLERANYEVCYVDLPQKVSGFAEIIAGKPHVALNRAKPLQDPNLSPEIADVIRTTIVAFPDPRDIEWVGVSSKVRNRFLSARDRSLRRSVPPPTVELVSILLSKFPVSQPGFRNQ